MIIILLQGSFFLSKKKIGCLKTAEKCQLVGTLSRTHTPAQCTRPAKARTEANDPARVPARHQRVGEKSGEAPQEHAARDDPRETKQVWTPGRNSSRRDPPSARAVMTGPTGAQTLVRPSLQRRERTLHTLPRRRARRTAAGTTRAKRHPTRPSRRPGCPPRSTSTSEPSTT